VLKKYKEFSGRARRKEYWMFLLFNVIILAVLRVVDGLLDTAGAIRTIYALVIFIPGLAVALRRLHDTGRSGWWLLIGLIPLIGWVVLLLFFVQEGRPGQNQYGVNPKETTA